MNQFLTEHSRYAINCVFSSLQMSVQTSVKLETSRFILREILPRDNAAMFEMDSDPDVHRFLGNKPLKTMRETDEVIAFIRQQYNDYGIGRWAIVDKSSQEFLGWGGYKYMTELTNNHVNYYDIGYRLLKKHWGKGVATEVTKACLEYGFNELKQQTIYGMADVNNHASRHVLEKCGLKYVEDFIWKDSTLCAWYEIKNPNLLQNGAI